MPLRWLRNLVTAGIAAVSFSGAFAIVHTAEISPVSGLSASAATPPARTTPASAPAPVSAATHTPAPAPAPVVQRAASAPVVVPAPVVIHRTVAPVVPAAPPPPPAPVVIRNYLTSGDGTLHTAVGVYSDCSGNTELTHAMAAIDTCMRGATYFVGHNAGVFTPLMHMNVGAIITYYDGGGTAHVWRVASVRPAWIAANGVPSVTEPDVVAQFQTCAVPDGSIDRILDVVPA